MYKDWIYTAEDLSQLLGNVRNGNPGVGRGFCVGTSCDCRGRDVHEVERAEAVAIGVAMRCDGCIAFHSKATVRYGASREEFLEMIGLAVYMGGGPSYTYGARALEAFDQFVDAEE